MRISAHSVCGAPPLAADRAFALMKASRNWLKAKNPNFVRM
jgi:hypothetical protein